MPLIVAINELRLQRNANHRILDENNDPVYHNGLSWFTEEDAKNLVEENQRIHKYIKKDGK
jgi:hypothetical protein